MSSDQAREVAERIARRVGAASAATGGKDISSELAAVRATLNELQNRLIQIESKVGAVGPAAPRMQSPWLGGLNTSHPSMERFGVEEATVSELVDFFQNEKACSLEPGGKPCDHCAMCSSRGF
ncbi:MAG TPA: hypothetical protein VGW58_18300 [Pyrinomonadaceae bacterium]|nr:hypothetical protein [Pyrinomonadaceae bacterium]